MELEERDCSSSIRQQSQIAASLQSGHVKFLRHGAQQRENQCCCLPIDQGIMTPDE